ncbi:MAG TPA: hypothetical protein DEB40_09270 [Elusimicrobia bacterium]|nr:hypothetical protein [Elusimicrobiota bacterium]HBT61919.1 hypothetical protein [Elusimicrobiota bacterium]
MAAPFFSVVINNHNYGRFLRQAVDSVLGQDFASGDVEVIVVDDGSTDDSRAILASYGDRVRVCLQARQGQAQALNRGFAEARGEIVCLLDSDDVWRPEKLSAVAGRFDDPAVGLVEHWLQDTDAALAPLPQYFPAWPTRYGLDDFLDGRAEFGATSGLCLRRKLIGRLGAIPAELVIDADAFLMEGALFFAEIANMARLLGAHRIHGGNWCAGHLADRRKLDMDLRMNEILAAELERRLAVSRRSLTPRCRLNREMETWRRRILQAALEARPAQAWKLWREKAGSFKGSGLGRFRLASVLLAVLSPSLYLWVYGIYSRSRGLREMRKTFFFEA